MAPIPPQTKATSRVPQKINDLAVLPVTLPAPKAYPHTAQHYLFIRPDAPKDADEISALNASILTKLRKLLDAMLLNTFQLPKQGSMPPG